MDKNSEENAKNQDLKKIDENDPIDKNSDQKNDENSNLSKDIFKPIKSTFESFIAFIVIFIIILMVILLGYKGSIWISGPIKKTLTNNSSSSTIQNQTDQKNLDPQLQNNNNLTQTHTTNNQNQPVQEKTDTNKTTSVSKNNDSNKIQKVITPHLQEESPKNEYIKIRKQINFQIKNFLELKKTDRSMSINKNFNHVINVDVIKFSKKRDKILLFCNYSKNSSSPKIQFEIILNLDNEFNRYKGTVSSEHLNKTSSFLSELTLNYFPEN